MNVTKLKGKLSLKNNGELSCFFVGTGSAFSKKYFQNNLLVIKGNDHILIDCGTLCPLAIEDFGITITDIKNFYLTHSHADHIGGMEEVALKNCFTTKKKPNIIISDEYKKILWEQSLQGGCAYVKTKDGHSVTFDDYFVQIKPKKLRTLKDAIPLWEANIGNINLKFFNTIHLQGKNTKGQSFHSTGVLIDNRVIFSGDGILNKKCLDYLCNNFNIECIFHDCGLLENSVHASYNELKSLPKELRSKIYLCHYTEDLLLKPATQDGFKGFVKRGWFYNF